MAFPLVSEVETDVQNLIGDPSVDVWDDTRLLPLVKIAYAVVARRLRANGYSIVEKQALGITIGPSVTTIPRAAADSGATDFTGSGLNDATFNAASVYSGVVPITFEVEIDANGAPDTFKWRKTTNAGTPGSYTTGVNITGAAQTLSDAVTVTFGATTGHTIGNSWLRTIAFYPSDLIVPMELRERTTGTTDELTIVDKNDGQLQCATDNVTSKRVMYDWKNDTIYVYPGTVSTDIHILYEKQLAAITSAASEIPIYNGREAISLVTAAYCARSWDEAAAQVFMKEGLEEADKLVIAEAPNTRRALETRLTQ